MKQSYQFVDTMLKKRNASVLILIKVFILAGIFSVFSFSNPAFSQDAAPKVIIKGKLLDAKGEPMPFVTLAEKGTNNATSTDLNGDYKLTVAGSNSVIAVSFVGYKPKEIVVGNQTEINIKMEEDSKVLNEVVVMGYGSQKKRDVTGATSSVSEKDLKDKPVTSFVEAMQGKMSGVQVMQSSGQPGGGSTIRVRGVGTTNNADPLVVIDGFPVEGGLSVIDQNTVEKIDVLKDASACAIYGSRGANGVILVTTKKGSKGRSQINFNTYHGVNQVIKIPQMLNGAQYAQFHNEMMKNGGQPINPDFVNPAQYGAGTNWLSEVLKPSKVDYYQLDMSGAADKSNYLMSASYLDQGGTFINSGYKRINLQLNNTTELNEKVSYGTTNTIVYENFVPVNYLSDALNMLPVFPVYNNSTGSYAGPGPIKSPLYNTYGNAINPVGQANVKDNTENKYRLISNAYVDYKPIKHLTFRTSGGLDFSYDKKRNWTPQYKWGVTQNAIANLWQSRDDNIITKWDNTLTYENTFKDHKLTALVGTSAQDYKSEYFNGQVNGFANPLTQQGNNGLTPYSVGGDYAEHTLFSEMGRVNYSFKDRYLATATVRHDGSSRFGSNYRYGTFPSASVAWRLSEENFFAGLRNKINDVKIRAGYGVTGNENIGNYSFANQIATNLKYSFGNTISSASAPVSLANPNVHWESVAQFNTGLDMAFFEDRFTVSADFYIKNTNGMLQQQPIASLIGLPGAQPYVNVGQVRNSGVELSINGTVLNTKIAGKVFRWNAGFNITFQKNQVITLYNDVPLYYQNVGLNNTLATLTEKQPIGEFYGYVTDGIFQTAADVKNHAKQLPGTAPGDVRFKDLNGDGVIDDKDRTNLGSPLPNYFYGLTNSFSFMGFEVSIFFQGVQGNKIFNVNRMMNESMSAVQNQYATTLNRWTGEGTSNTVPRAVYGDPSGNARVSDRWIEDGSYLRLKNLTVSYTVTSSLVSKLHLRSLSIYGSGQNLWTLTKYSGFNPEVDPSGIDNAQYPSPRTLTIGAKLGL